MQQPEAHASWLRKPAWLQAFQTPSDDARYLTYCRAFALASAFRLTLPDALQPDWLGPTALHWVGAGLLAANGCVAGWLLCGVGLSLPLLFLEDQLSQSAYLLFCSVAALLHFLGPEKHRARRLNVGLSATVRTLTLLVYLLAAVHKLNSGYLNPTISCANAGLHVLADGARYGVPDGLLGMLDSRVWPIAHLAVEFTIPLLLLWRPAWGVALAALMHVPLTLIFAPNFAVVMASGWVCFFSARQLTTMWSVVRSRRVRVVLIAGALIVASRALLFPGRWEEDPEWCIKEGAFLVIVVCLGVGISGASLHGARRDPLPLGNRGAALTALFLLNGLSPYFGVQFHHTGAMLSNLRIDRDCHNSLLFPPWLVLRDPYVRLDRIDFAPGRATDEVHRSALSRLWSPAALHRKREVWCRIHDEPLPVAGRLGGRRFSVPDFCASDGWPLPKPPLDRIRLFQVNLNRECGRRCLH